MSQPDIYKASRLRQETRRKEQGQLVKGLRRRPLTAETRVRFPYWLLEVQSSDLVALFVLQKSSVEKTGFSLAMKTANEL